MEAGVADTERAMTPSRTGRLRRIVQSPPVLALTGAIVVVTAWMGSAIVASLVPENAAIVPFLAGVFVAAVTALAYRGFVRWVERGGDGTLPFDGRVWLQVGTGSAIGIATFAAAILLLALLGGVSFTGLRGNIGALWPMLGIAVMSGVTEEILFRGVLFRQVERMAGSWIALILTSALFGAAHLINPDSSIWASLAIMVEAGLMLTAIYMLTRSLWPAIGLHAGWNFTQGWVFSVPVSGGLPPAGLIVTERSGPDWLTGGAFGLEASVVAAAVATLVGVAIMALAIRKGQVAPMSRQTKL